MRPRRLGEYAAHDDRRINTLRSALAEAAYLTALERNGDVVHLASYPPLLAKQGRTPWRPDMIYFDNTTVVRSANYFLQQMFGQNAADVYLGANATPAATNISVCCVKNSATGDPIVKLVNVSVDEMRVDLRICGLEN